ncbi:hypothetical protein GW17_00056421 [Ensete ventricosum]|nr:hypothetical protein GW17_00056421 [Ensete ventricosum]RZS06914.1 hypothetical protein BHM03_00037648 [Ensete ventricosum]
MAWLPARGGRLWPGPMQGVAARRGSSPQGAATRGHGQLRPARRGGRLRLALSPAGAAAPVVGVATPWQGGFRPQRATAAYVGVVTTTVQ